MHPTLLTIPLPWGKSLAIPAYGTMLMVGFLLAVLLARRRAGSVGLAKPQVFDLGFCLIIGGIVGARLLHVLLNLGFYFAWPGGVGFFRWAAASSFRVIATWNGGLVYYGGLGGGILAVWLYARAKKIPLADMLDFVAPGAALGLAVTRLGCFLNGCCFGRHTDLPWAVTFPPKSYVHYHQLTEGLISGGEACRPVHPTQLYELAAALAIFAALWALYPRRRFAGGIACLFGLLYAGWRFVNEFFRADSGPWRPGGRDLGPLTVFQYMSIPLLVLFAVLLAGLWRRGRAPYAPPDERPAPPRPAGKGPS